MSSVQEAADARSRVATGERVLSLSECAERLRMKRSNVAKFLARRGVEPAFPKAQGYFWWASDIERVKAEREADERRMTADEKRRHAALHGRAEARAEPPPPELRRIGATQRAVLSELLRRPVRPETDAERLALRRLRERGLVESVPGERGVYQLNTVGRAAAVRL
jgi:hypothetical protein